MHLAQCDLLVERTGATPLVAGWTATDIQAAYRLPSTEKGNGQIVAIVDAYDNPKVASDLAAYRAYFGFPKAHFAKYNQDGEKGHYPQHAKGWGQEIDLDVEMVSAVCPSCTIYLIEATKNIPTDLYAAEQTAVKLGATIVSNSWGGGGGFPSGGAFDSPGVTYVASAGDNGYGAQDPADYDDVVAVGGTVLSKQSGSYGETVWEDTGGGCSSEKKPLWQYDRRCKFRTGNDVSAVASNVAFYDTYGLDGWSTADGTSVSAPIIAGVFALAGDAAKQTGGRKIWRLRKSRRQDLHYISSGQIAGCPTRLQGTYLCTAGTNQLRTYSAPAGWGTPNGIGAF